MKIRISIIFLSLLLLQSGSYTFGVSDPLAAEIARWKDFIRTNRATDEDWKSLRDITEPVIARAAQALADRRRLYALHLLSAARPLLAAQKYTIDQPAAAHEQMNALEAEWRKVGKKLQPVMGGNNSPSFSHLNAANRAVAETALSEIKPYYDASLEYGKNTAPEYGLYYLGSATSQMDFVKFCSTLSESSLKKPPNVTNLPAELEQFEDDLLAEYKPPASMDQHPLFIRVSAMIKESREMYDAGLKYGALYRYLDARVRFSRLKTKQQVIDAAETTHQAKTLESRLNSEPVDHSIAALFSEMALAEIANPGAGTNGGATAWTIFGDVIPHYFAALQPPKPEQPKAAPAHTITLVRWPYT
jgi:hypothetical protein